MADDDLSLANPVPGQSQLGIQDLVNIALPAIVGAGVSQSRGQGAGIGALAGIGTGIETQQGLQDLAMKRQEAVQGMAYKRQLMQQAHLGAQKAQLELSQMQEEAKDEGAFMANMTPEEKAQYRADPKGFWKDKRNLATLEPNLKILSTATGYSPEELKGLSPEQVSEATIKVLSQPDTKPQVDVFFKSDGGVRKRVAVDKNTGATLWTKDASQPLTATERKTLADERTAVGQVDSALDLLSNLKDATPHDMLIQAQKYRHSGVTGLLSEAGVTDEVDPQYAQLFGRLGQAKAILSRAYLGGRMSVQLFNQLTEHIPEIDDSPKVMADKLSALKDNKSILNTMIRVIKDQDRMLDNSMQGKEPPALDKPYDLPSTSETSPPAATPTAGAWKVLGPE